jgi:hypothetical protein
VTQWNAKLFFSSPVVPQDSTQTLLIQVNKNRDDQLKRAPCSGFQGIFHDE